MVLAPIAYFVYNRLAHTQQSIEALKKNKHAADSEIIIFSDAPKQKEDIEEVFKVRKFIKTLDGFKKITIREREENYGLARSFISGITEVVNQHNKVIVLEDDSLTSPYCLQFLNDALNIYENENNVISINAYVYPFKKPIRQNTFFIRGADTWGFATWKRAWDLFESDSQKLKDEIIRRNKLDKFKMNGSFPFMELLQKNIEGKNNSYTIRWYGSAILHDMLTLYPSVSFVHNTGFDGTGTHASNTDIYNTKLCQTALEIKKIPAEESKEALQEIENFYRTLYKKQKHFRIFQFDYYIGRIKKMIYKSTQHE